MLQGSSWRFGFPRGIAARAALLVIALLGCASSWVLYSVPWEAGNTDDDVQRLRLSAVVIACALSGFLMLIRERRREPSLKSEPQMPVLPWWADPMGTAAFDGVFTLDEAALIRSVNYGSEELFGYTSDELMGRSLFQIIPPDSDFNGAEKLADADDRWDGIRLSVTGLRKDGETFPLEMRLTRFERGSRAMYFGVCRREVKEIGPPKPAPPGSWAGRFMGRIGRDVNRSATAIEGFLDVMLERLPDDDGIRSDVAEVRATGRQIAQLSQSLQIVARIPCNGARTSLHPWLEKFARQYGGKMSAGKSVELYLHATDPVVTAQPTFLRVVMVYLLEGIGGGGGGEPRIQIRTRQEAGSPHVLLEVLGAKLVREPDSLPFEVARAILAKSGGGLEVGEGTNGEATLRLQLMAAGKV